MRSPRSASRCPDGEALTAHAHGEGDVATRAAMARHLLSCPACHAQHDQDAELFVGLAALGATRSAVPSAAAATARTAEHSLETRSLEAHGPGTRRWTAWLPPVAAAVLVGAALLLPSGGDDERLAVEPSAPRIAPSASYARVGSMLEAQAPDGHWAAEAGPLGSQPCAATAVVLLALLHEREGGGAALSSDPSLTASLERGAGYLLARLERPDATLHALPTAERAVLLAALARTSLAAPSARLTAAARTLVDDMRQRLALAPPDASSVPWLDYALEAAVLARVPGAEAVREGLDGADQDAAWRTAPQPARFPTLDTSDAPACTPVRSALEVLRDEPPLRLLALGPTCRSVARLAQR
jgi:hypothetical protein